MVQNCTIKDAGSVEELKKWNALGESQRWGLPPAFSIDSPRHVAATQMNATSSRSHLVFSILVESKVKATGGPSMRRFP